MLNENFFTTLVSVQATIKIEITTGKNSFVFITGNLRMKSVVGSIKVMK